MGLSLEEKQHWADARGMTLEEYEKFLEEAEAQYYETMVEDPDGTVAPDPDVAAFMELDAIGQELPSDVLEQFKNSTVDALIHEQSEEE